MRLNKFGRHFSLVLTVSLATLFVAVLGGQTPASAAAGTIGGRVFADFNSNGTYDSSPAAFGAAIDRGVGGVVVKAFDSTGAEVGSATTDTAAATVGQYNLSVAAAATSAVRLEFTTPADFKSSFVGTNSEGAVQFLTLDTTNADYAISVPANYCQDNPQICQAAFAKAAVKNTLPTVSTFPYSAGYAGTGNQGVAATASDLGNFYNGTNASPGFNLPAPTKAAGLADTGPVYGVAWQPQSKSIFVSAYLKTNAVCDTAGQSPTPLCDNYPLDPALRADIPSYGFGPGGVGGVYRIDITNPAAPVVTTMPSVPNPGTEPYTADLVNGATANGMVGRVSLGDLEFSADRRTLFVTNLNDRKVYQMSMNLNGTSAGAWSVAYDFSAAGLTAPGCTAAKTEPFGLGWKPTAPNAGLFVGVSCDFGNYQSWAPFESIHVYSTASSSYVVSSTRDYYRTSSSWGGIAVSDLEFDGADIIMGERDLWGDWNTVNNAGGDIQRACYDSATSTWAMEAPVWVAPHAVSSQCGGVVTTDPTPPRVIAAGFYGTDEGFRQGPAAPGRNGGQTEFYFDDQSEFTEAGTYGALTMRPGSDYVVTTMRDPFRVYTAGVFWMNNRDGSADKALESVNDGLGGAGLGKIGIMADLEMLCDMAPVQIGNRIWDDTNKDGIQDPGEPPVAGVTVQLADAAGATVLGTAVTDAEGRYVFSSDNNEVAAGTGDNKGGGLPIDTAVQLRVDMTQAAIGGKVVTGKDKTSATPLDDSVDSDASISGTFAVINVPAHAAGANDHTFDIGLIPPPPRFDLALTKALAAGQSASVRSDDDVTFTISVTNQGNVAGSNVVVTDYIPAGWTLNDPYWTAGADGRSATTTLASVPVGVAPVTIDITLKVGQVTAPPATANLTPTGASASGTVFRDYNADAVKGVEEPGQGSAWVTATCVSDVGADGLAGTADDSTAAPVSVQTAVDGTYSLTGLRSNWCRIEFTPSVGQTFLGSGVAGKSQVQFLNLASGNATAVDVGLQNPAEYTPSLTPDVVTGYVLQRDPLTGATVMNARSQMRFPANSAGTADSAATGAAVATMHNKQVATFGDLGTVWGIAYSPSRNLVYTSAWLRAHVGVGPSGIDAILKYTPSGAGAVSTFTTAVDTDGGAVLANAARGINNAVNPNLQNDTAATAAVGKAGWGDIDLSEDDKYLWAMNLYDRTLYKFDLDTSTVAATYPVPDPGCTNGTYRPWGLGVKDGRVFSGVICDGSATTTQALTADLTASVFPLDVASGTWGPNMLDGDPSTAAVEPLALNYARQCGGPGAQNCGWYPWRDTDALWTAPLSGGAKVAADAVSPILSDLDFDNDGSLILSFLDRAAMQLGSQNYGPNPADTTLWKYASAGEVLRARPTLAANATTTGFLIEQGGQSASGPALPIARAGGRTTPAGQGPGGGEFYSFEEIAAAGHYELGMGSALQIPGSSNLIISNLDPSTVTSGGVVTYSNATGAKVRFYEMHKGEQPYFGKTQGLMDIEMITSVAPIEIGNRVWRDLNGNGVQDPSEPPLAGVTVTLDDGAVGNTATATTNANGNYLFSSATSGPAGAGATYGLAWMTPAAHVTVTFPLTVAGETLTIPRANTATGAGVADSNPIVATGKADVTLGAAGWNDHTIDAGYVAGGAKPPTGKTWNFAEISAVAGNPTDVDSTPDATNGNSRGEQAGPYADQNIANLNGDEDDHDGVEITVLPPSFDLALTKVLAVGQASPVVSGGLATFSITVTNQGSIDATNVEVTDYIPTGFTLADDPAKTSDDGWTAATDGRTAKRTIASVVAGASSTIDVTLRVGQVAPSPTAGPNPTVGGAISGTAYVDPSGNGVINAAGTSPNDPLQDKPLAGVFATAVCVSDKGADGIVGTADDSYAVPVSDGPTGATGTYTLAVTGSPCRVEFTIPEPYRSSPAGTDMGSSVVFANAGDTGVDILAMEPGSYCQDNPKICAATFTRLAAKNTLSTFGYNSGYTGTGGNGLSGATSTSLAGPTGSFGGGRPASSYQPAISQVSTMTQTGPIYGVAWRPESRSIYASAYLKVDAVCSAWTLATPCAGYPNLGPDYGFGPGGIGGVYRIDMSNPAAPTVVSFPSVPNAGTNPLSSSSDGKAASALIGEVSLGDLELSGDHRTLYVTNFNDKSLYQLALNVDGTANGSWVKSLDFTTILPARCSAPKANPFGLGWKKSGLNAGLFVGVMCDWTAYASTPTSGPSFNIYSVAAGSYIAQWPTMYRVPGGVAGSMIGDLQFDGDDIIVGERQVEGDDNGPFGFGGGNTVGDIQRVCFSSGTWSAEAPVPPAVAGNASVSSTCGGRITTDSTPPKGVGGSFPTGAGPGYRQGPRGPGNTGGQTEWFFDDQGDFDESAYGALAVKPGTRYVLTTMRDPLTVNSAGVFWMNLDDGSADKAFEIGNDATFGSGFGKGGGMADIEVMCDMAPIEIGNRVWRDANANGIQDPGEPAIAGVSVTVDDGSGGHTATVTTDSQGRYYFSNARDANVGAVDAVGTNVKYDLAWLKPGTTVTLTFPTATAGLVLTTNDASDNQVPLAPGNPAVPSIGGTDRRDSDPNPTSGTVLLTLGAAGDVDHTIDAGYKPATQLPPAGHYFNFAEISAVGGNLIDIDSIPDSVNGNRYGEQVGPYTDQSVTGTNGDEDDHDGASIEVTAPVYSLGNRVWIDNGAGAGGVANDGIINGTEAGVDGVTVKLFEANAAGAATGAAVQSATTISGGFYRFDGLVPGDYVVVVIASNFAAAGPLAGFVSSAGATNWTGATDVDSKDHGLDALLGAISVDPGGLATAKVSLGASLQPTGETNVATLNPTGEAPDDRSNLTIDFGLYQPIDLAVVKSVTSSGLYVPGSTVTYSLVATNIGPGIAKAGWSLTDLLPTGLSYAATAATGTDFTCPAPSVGSVTCTNGTALAVGATATLTVNAVVDGGVADLTGLKNVAYVSPATGDVPESITLGTPPTAATDTVASATNNDSEASLTTAPHYSVGNRVSNDTDNSGTENGSETGIADVTMQLFAADGAGNPTGTAIATVVTDSTGYYRFDGLLAGSYVPVVAAPNFALAGVLAGWSSSTGSASTFATGDEKTDHGIDTATPAASGVRSAAVILGAGMPTGEMNPGTYGAGSTTGTAAADSRSNLTADFGFFQPASLGNYVWFDDNRNGVQDEAAARGVNGVTATLTDMAGAAVTDASGVTVAAVMTANDGSANPGFYQFTNLLPGQYKVVFSTLPSGFAATVTSAAGSTTANDSNGLTATSVVLVSGANDPTLDLGLFAPVSVGNLVWEDLNANGIQDSGEPGLAGAKVTLLDMSGNPVTVDAYGTAIAPIITSSTGLYTFGNLLPGQYKVSFAAPAGYFGSPVGQGADPTVDSNGATATSTVMAAGGADPTLDSGFFKPVSLGNYVWFDDNHNGIQDEAGARGVNGVTATLTDMAGTPFTSDLSGNPIAPKLTANDGSGNAGYYSFTNLKPGQYKVVFSTLPTGFGPTKTNAAGSTTANDSNGLTATSTVLASGADDPTLDLGLFASSMLGNRVWEDLNGNGIQDSGEPGVLGATVTLLDASGNPVTTDADGVAIAPITTPASGAYLFANLLPGTYKVRFTLPAGYVATDSNIGSDDAIDSDGVTTATTSLAPNQSDLTLDLGVFKPASLGDFVWLDANANGIQDVGESGVSGVTATLLDAAGFPVTTDASGTAIMPKTTDALGAYSFTNLKPGTYKVSFSGLPSLKVPTATNQGTDHAKDSDGMTTATTTLASGQHDPTLDLGIVGGAAVGNLVWVDLNRNGLQDSGEPGVPGVTVTLQDSTGTVITTDIAGNPITPQTTGADGSYGFANLPAGSYQVVFSNLPAGFVIAPTNRGSDDTIDSDGLTTAPVTLILGQYDPSLDLGLFAPVSLGDYVWFDDNHNGFQDEAPARGANGVTVTLTDMAGTVVTTDADGNPVVAQTTANDASGNPGFYRFLNLMPGTYKVVFSTLPSGFSATITNAAGSTTANDSDGLTATSIVLAAGQHDPKLDLGLFAPGAVGNLVWEDLNGNGVQDSGEPGLAGVTVTLLDSAGNPVTVDAFGTAIAPITTTGSGLYNFANLLPGIYKVSFSAPTGYVGSPAGAGTDPTLDSNSPLATSSMLAPNQADMTLDAGFYRPVSLGNYVWYDLDRDGIQDGTELAAVNVSVTLTDTAGSPVTNASGVLVAATQTDGSGLYSFTTLKPGQYKVVFSSLPTGFEATITNAVGSTLANDSNGLTATSVVLASGDSDLTLDLGLFAPAKVGDRVWLDLNADGIQDGGEAGLVGVTVTLLDAAGNPVTVDAYGTAIVPQVTTGTGAYLFGNLLPGTYKVSFSGPAGYVASPATRGADPTVDSNGPLSAAATLGLNGSDLTLDAGFFQPVSVGNYVWIDANRNGIQDESASLGVNGVTVTLTDMAGNPIADSSGATVGTATTLNDDAGNPGFYQFTNLKPGQYKVVFSTLPAGFAATVTNAGGSTTANDSNGLNATSVVLTSGQNDPTLDLGIFAPVTVGDWVWLDTNGDGIQTAGEAGLAGVTVTLLDMAGNPVTTDAYGNPIVPYVTTGTGAYTFGNLLPGQYKVSFSAPVGYLASPTAQGLNLTLDSDGPLAASEVLAANQSDLTVDAGFYQSVTVGDLVWIDNDRNGIQDSTDPGVAGVTATLTDMAGHPVTVDAYGNPVVPIVTPGSGAYLFSNLPPGQYKVAFSTLPAGYLATLTNAVGSTASNDSNGLNATSALLASGQSDVTLDLGLFKPVTVGDRVWVDPNRNGTQDAGEPGIAGVTVTLTDMTGNPVVDAAGNPVAPIVTPASGAYLFSNLVPGQYNVAFGTLPSGYAPTLTNAAGSTPLNDSNGVLATSNVLMSGQSDVTLDLGLFAPVTVGDFVWVDLNGNGIQDSGEPGLAGVTVTLLDSAGNPVTVDAYGNPIAPAVTSGTGEYLFGNLLPGLYKVVFTTPTGYVGSPATQGADPSKDSDGPTAISVALASNEVDATLDAGFYMTASLGDYVWLDINQNGVQDSGEAPMPGVVVNVYRANGTLAGTTTTDATGMYLVTGLAPGTYTVEVMPTAGYVLTSPTIGSDPTKDSNIVVATHRSTPVVLVSGQTDSTVDAGLVPVGSLEGVVFVDANKNGVQDAGEKVLANIEVYVLNSAGLRVATVRTDGNGHFLVTDLPVGRYRVKEVQPQNFKSTTPDEVWVDVPHNKTSNVPFGEAKVLLPTTGGSIFQLLALATVLLGAGAVVAAVGRRRRSAAAVR